MQLDTLYAGARHAILIAGLGHGRAWGASVQQNWHILRVQEGRESDAASTLLLAPGYVPMLHRRTFNRRLRKSVWTQAPILPGYVFVDTPLARDVVIPNHKITRGFLRNGDGSYALVNPRSMASMRQMEADLARQVLLGNSFVVGAHVRIVDGPFRDLIATINRITGNKICLDLPGYKWPVEINKDSVDLAA